MEGYTVFFTYSFASVNSVGIGYSDAVHCNYINSIEVDTIHNKEINIYFDDINDFRFLATGTTAGSGYTANRLNLIAQIVNNSNFETKGEIRPISNEWKIIDITDQIRDRIAGSDDLILPLSLVSSMFKVSLLEYNNAPKYKLDYLNYPSNILPNTTALSFGDEDYFIGNVTTDIAAIAHTTDLVINLPINEFNSSTNPTWDKASSIYMSEVFIYDEDKNVIAVGKFNNPIQKDATISRTIVFAIDF